MNCVVITNGGDNGEDFVRQCRSIRSNMAIAIYCMSKAYHQQWATKISGPDILVTGNSQQVLDFIEKNLKK